MTAGSINVIRFKHFLAVALASQALAGCSLLQEFFDPPPTARTEDAPPPLESRPRVEPINRNYFTLANAEDSVVGQPQIVFARNSDTFSDLAREYGLGYDEIVAANPDVDPWLPGAGTAVLLPTQYVLPDVPRRGVVLNIASKRLFYFPPAAEGEPQSVMTYPIGIGRVGWETPLGETTVVSKAKDPHWYVPASVRKEHEELGDPLPAVVPPGPENPLGSHVLKLGIPGYLIHGTNQPYGVGMRVSHGCVRLYPENIELLYSLIDIGEPVSIVNKPFLVGYAGGELYFESHEPLEDDEVAAEQHLQALFSVEPALSDEAEQNAVRSVAASARGVPVRTLLSDAFEIYERARLVRNTVEVDPDAPTLEEIRAMMDEPDDVVDDIPEAEPAVVHE